MLWSRDTRVFYKRACCRRLDKGWVVKYIYVEPDIDLLGNVSQDVVDLVGSIRELISQVPGNVFVALPIDFVSEE